MTGVQTCALPISAAIQGFPIQGRGYRPCHPAAVIHGRAQAPARCHLRAVSSEDREEEVHHRHACLPLGIRRAPPWTLSHGMVLPLPASRGAGVGEEAADWGEGEEAGIRGDGDTGRGWGGGGVAAGGEWERKL